MLRLAFIFAFIISAGAATLGLLMSNNLRKQHVGQTIFATLLYQQIFVFIFALYSIWGFIFFKLVFSTELLPPGLVEKISTVQTIIAVPFQLFSWWFLIQLIFELVHLKNVRWKSTIALTIIILLMFPVYLLFFKDPTGFHHSVSPLFCIINSLVYSLIFVVLLVSRSAFLETREKRIASFFIWSIGLSMSAATLFYSHHVLLTLLFILLFFTLNLWPLILFSKWVQVPLLKVETEVRENFEALCQRYEISKREAEIIECICEGLTNQEIADRLFISLQTVKDHTSRIYLKTEVKNRTQLANLVRGNP